MKKTQLGIIGGSGLTKLEGLKELSRHKFDTPFGSLDQEIIEAEIEGKEGVGRFFFLPRHGEGHRLSPSEINYRANIYAMKKLGVKNLLSLSAVGSLREEFAPRSFVLPSQFIDWTKGLRKRSFFDKGMVGHVSVAQPVNNDLQKLASNVLEELEISHHLGGSYVCIEGPQFSSRAESEIYRNFGASVIGMTNVPEVYLAKEAGLAYATVAMVTDYDCWKDEHCTLEEVLSVMKDNYNTAQNFLTKIVPRLFENPIKFERENEDCVVTSPSLLNATHKEILSVLQC